MDTLRRWKPSSFAPVVMSLAPRRRSSARILGVGQASRRSGAGGTPAPHGDGPRTATIDRIPDPASADLDAHWEEEWQKNLMAAALAKIKHQVKAKQFQMFDLYALQQWPVREVARTMKVSVAQVYLARHRVAALLQKEVKRLEASSVNRGS